MADSAESGPHCETCTCGCTCGWGGQHSPDNPRCDLNNPPANPHDFTEDVDDASMCVCGVPALTHDRVYPPEVVS